MFINLILVMLYAIIGLGVLVAIIPPVIRFFKSVGQGLLGLLVLAVPFWIVWALLSLFQTHPLGH